MKEVGGRKHARLYGYWRCIEEGRSLQRQLKVPCPVLSRQRSIGIIYDMPLSYNIGRAWEGMFSGIQ